MDENRTTSRMPLIGDRAPEFHAMTTKGKIDFPQDYSGSWVVLFSHPADFTPVCTTEFIAFSKAYTYFQQLNTELIGLSIDSNSSHLAWLYDIYCKTGIKVSFPIIADRNGQIARKYGMISNDISILSVPYAVNNFHSMRYIEFMGAKWKVSDVEVQYPRLLLTLGGLYNG